MMQHQPDCSYSRPPGTLGLDELRHRLTANPPKNVLIMVRGHLGDAVNSTGAVRRIAERFPKARVTVDVGLGPVELMRRVPQIAEVWGRNRRRGLIGKFATINRIRRARFDLGIVLFESNEAVRHLRLAGVPLRVGVRRADGGEMFTASIPHNPDQHDLFDTLPGVLTMLEAETDIAPFISITPEEHEVAEGILKHLATPEDEPLIGMHIGATTPRKQWPLEHFQELAQRLQNPIILFGPGEEALAAQVPGRRLPRLLSLFEYAALIKRLNVLVTNDSGPAHIAAAVGTGEVVIFGPTAPIRFHPFGDRATCLWKANECDAFSGECESIKSGLAACDHRCLRRISVDEVREALGRCINQGAPGA